MENSAERINLEFSFMPVSASDYAEKTLFLALFFAGIGNCEKGPPNKFSISRSYEIPYSLLNNPQGLQYYTTGQLYTAVPTVLIPSQIAFQATPVPNVVYQQKEEPKAVRGISDGSSSLIKANDAKAAHYHKQKYRNFGLGHVTKRPGPYHNSVHPYTVRLKPVVPIPTQKISSSSLQSGQDTRSHYIGASSNVYPSTVGPPSSSTYGSAKPVDFHQKFRGPGQVTYHRMKGSTHRHPMFTSKKIYSHLHKGHIHTHYYPANHPSLLNKDPQSVKYAPQIYSQASPVSSPGAAQAGILQQNYKIFEYNSGTQQVRFPAEQETLQHSSGEKNTNNAPGDVTQAIFKNPGVINNYDTALPLKVPSKKPYKFEVNEILKNSDLHFAQENADKEYENDQKYSVLQYGQNVPLVNGISYGPQQVYTTLPLNQASFISTNPLEVYSFSGSTAYQNNQIASDQDSSTSETVKVPVAIIKGTHNVISPSIFGFPMKRQDEKNSENLKKDFTPSKRTSDWIPTTGNGVPLLINNDASIEKPVRDVEENYSDEFNVFASHSSSSNGNANKKTVRNRQIGDIISAKIPEEFAPKEGQIVGSNVPYTTSLSYDGERGKGGVVDVNASTSSDVSQTGDTSNLVVSSVIKFS